jgi:dimeric dUTPase (all-alpha-NTP-PPase superfamily)
MDKLDTIFDEQLKLNLKVNPEFLNLVKDTGQVKKDWIDKVSVAMIAEIAEILQTFNNFKWWKNKEEVTEEKLKNLRVEVIDVFHFLILMAQLLGMDGQDFYNLYLAKKELNHKRQDNGYKEGTYQKVDENGKEDNYYLK